MPDGWPFAALHDRLSRGSMRTRGVYERARAFARRRQLVPRRKAVARLGDPATPRIADDDGHLVLGPHPVPGVAPVVEAARRLRAATDTSPESELWTRSEGRNLLRVPLENRLADEPEWIALALDPALLSTVSQYLGSMPLLSVTQLWISPYAEHAPDGKRLEHRYHCDWAAVRQLRVLTFIEDITPEHGPLTLIPARKSHGVRSARAYTFGEVECTILDDDLFSHVSRDDERRLTGPSGTIAFVDTSRCFHQGSRVLRPGLERVMVMFQYMTVTAFKLSSSFARRSPFAHLATPAHSEPQRMALGAV
jgi:hypothetical protein